jgi:xylan 1,4-beta-xylosidase
LNKLGDQRIALSSDSALLTRRNDGSLVLALWKYGPTGQPDSSRAVTLRFKDTSVHHVLIWRLDADHGDVHRAYAKLGEPGYPTQAQIQQLREASELAPPENVEVQNQTVNVPVPSDGLVLIELR